jgi:hypothetical protein
MPKFFLHLREHEEFIEDTLGIGFVNLAAAQEEAERSAREMMAESLREGRQLDGQQIEICDETGALLAVVRFRDVLNKMSD